MAFRWVYGEVDPRGVAFVVLVGSDGGRELREGVEVSARFMVWKGLVYRM